MAVYRDTGGIWRFRVSVLIRGERGRLSGTPLINTRAAAQQMEREAIIEAQNRPLPEPEKVPSVLFSSFALEWLATHPPAANRKSTESHRESHIRVHLIPYFGATPLDQIDNLALTKFVAALRATKRHPRNRKPGTPAKNAARCISPRSIQHIVRTLHKIFVDAVAWKKLSAMPVFPRIKVSDAPFDWLSPEESQRLLQAAYDPLAQEEASFGEFAQLLFAMRTGCRIGEQLAVERSDVNLATGKVTFKSCIYRDEEGPTKTGYKRTVNLSPMLRSVLKRYFDQTPGCVRVFESAQRFSVGEQDVEITGQPLTYGHYRAMLKKLLHRAGLREISWHALRHTFASQLVAAGVNLRYVQEALGHSTITMTMRYAHLAPSNGDEVAMLDNLPAKALAEAPEEALVGEEPTWLDAEAATG